MIRRITPILLSFILVSALVACAGASQTGTESPVLTPLPSPSATPGDVSPTGVSYPYPPAFVEPTLISTDTVSTGDLYPYPPSPLGPAEITAEADTTGVLSPSPVIPTPRRPTPQPTVRPTLTHSIATRFAILFKGWSPDGRFLSYLSQTLEDAANSPVGEGFLGPFPGTMHFYDVETGEDCEYPQDNPLGLDFFRWFTWMPDGRLIVLSDSGELALLDEPCAAQSASSLPSLPETISDVLVSSADGSQLLLQGESGCWLYEVPSGTSVPVSRCSRNASFSPGGDRLGITFNLGGAEYSTAIFNTTTGRSVRSIPWTFTNGLGDLPGPVWLDNQRFLISRTDSGPQLVMLGANFQVQPVADTFFDLTGSTYQYVDAATSPDGDSFHLLLTEVLAQGTGNTRILLYHPEDGEVENIQFTTASFSQNGQFLDLSRSVIVNEFEETERWLRPVDPPRSTAIRITSIEDQDFPSLSAVGRVAVARLAEPGSPTTLVVKDAVTGEVIHNWFVDPYLYAFYWSPSGGSLAAIGTALQGGEQAIYLLMTAGE